MPPIVQSASSIFVQAVQHLTADGLLATDDYLPGGIWPKQQAGVTPMFSSTPAKPFAYLRLLPGNIIAVETHTLAAKPLTGNIRRGAERIEQLLDYAQWQPPTDSIRYPLQTICLTATMLPTVPDLGWTTIKHIQQFVIDTQ